MVCAIYVDGAIFGHIQYVKLGPAMEHWSGIAWIRIEESLGFWTKIKKTTHFWNLAITEDEICIIYNNMERKNSAVNEGLAGMS